MAAGKDSAAWPPWPTDMLKTRTLTRPRRPPWTARGPLTFRVRLCPRGLTLSSLFFRQNGKERRELPFSPEKVDEEKARARGLAAKAADGEWGEEVRAHRKRSSRVGRRGRSTAATTTARRTPRRGRRPFTPLKVSPPLQSVVYGLAANSHARHDHGRLQDDPRTGGRRAGGSQPRGRCRRAVSAELAVDAIGRLGLPRGGAALQGSREGR